MFHPYWFKRWNPVYTYVVCELDVHGEILEKGERFMVWKLYWTQFLGAMVIYVNVP